MRPSPSAITTALLSFAASAQAHPGHDAISEWHWHATDLVGFLVVAVLAGVAIWLSRGD